MTHGDERGAASSTGSDRRPDDVADLDRVDPADAVDPLDVLRSIELSRVLSLGQEGSEAVDWASLVPDRSGECPECGLPDGPKHHRRCLAHPRPTPLWPVLVTCALVPLPLTAVAGPYAYGFFVPTIALALWIRRR